MAESMTVITALKYQSGVIIAADSQASDPTAQVRWPLEKLDRVDNHSLIVGFSGSVGMAQRARTALMNKPLHANVFKKRDLVRDFMDRCVIPVYEKIKQNNHPPTAFVPGIALWSLSAFWAEGGPQILEYEIDGDSSFHDHFHAIGSASNTARAVWSTLGGSRLIELNEPKAILAVLRILRTCIGVEMWGVSEPLTVWVVGPNVTRKLSEDELGAHLQLVDEWEEKERRDLFHS